MSCPDTDSGKYIRVRRRYVGIIASGETRPFHMLEEDFTRVYTAAIILVCTTYNKLVQIKVCVPVPTYTRQTYPTYTYIHILHL